MTITDSDRMRRRSREARAGGTTVGFVPTMGYLHEGHLSLVRRARRECGLAVVSIFVNPAQFGPGEDLANYPRDPARDRALLEKEGIDVIFSPEAAAIYRPDHATWVTVEGLTAGLCGRSRPGHFRGVTTIVTKLIHIVEPDVVYLGQKDAQQAIVLGRMARDLDMAVRIEVCPTVREADGLAMSSRNEYLSGTERSAALVLSRSLARAAEAAAAGEHSARALVSLARELLDAEPLFEIEYVELVDTENLQPIEGDLGGEALLAAAGRVGKTRLIDNVTIAVKTR
jgi:pantoate--beta-alanine ligase